MAILMFLDASCTSSTVMGCVWKRENRSPVPWAPRPGLWFLLASARLDGLLLPAGPTGGVGELAPTREEDSRPPEDTVRSNNRTRSDIERLEGS